MIDQPSRRRFLQQTSCGFGSLALSGILANAADIPPAGRGRDPLAPRPTHFPPKIKRVIFLFMQGGVSHVDSFDHKPRLEKDDGKMLGFDDARIIANSGMKGSNQRIMKSPWKFSRHGESGHWGSTLFPKMNEHMDEFCFIHSLQTEGVAHGPATLFLHCGSTNTVRPSMGSWLLYGLGTENGDLPGFVTIAPTSGNGGPRNYGSAFLPPIYQGTAIGRAGTDFAGAGIKNLGDTTRGLVDQKRRLDLILALGAEQRAARPGDAELEAVIASYELAWRMQGRAPEILDLERESKAVKDLYGIGEKPTDSFGRQCLMARRLCEAGVRFVQVTYGDGSANPAWDQHSNLQKHADHARAVDKPISGLLTDLAARGLLDDTLVWWGSEFGRTPYAEKNGTGRDHNPGGFTVWLAGGGVKKAYSHGETDEFGHLAVNDRVHMHDLHATILHLLGIDHERLTYRFSGRDFRLTDVHGRVVSEILA
ncbi:MAG: DUF1501 domain-containing protein [Isosphaeraceae bacterium]|nr:DUF1501 domain-containing protein [Isosphaeraceae bacterium]